MSVATMTTSEGEITIELFDDASCAAAQCGHGRGAPDNVTVMLAEIRQR
jgi:hypothetical protein